MLLRGELAITRTDSLRVLPILTLLILILIGGAAHIRFHHACSLANAVEPYTIHATVYRAQYGRVRKDLSTYV